MKGLLLSPLMVFCLVAPMLCHAEGTCPDVQIVGLNGNERLAILQGCPGQPGAVGPKGEPGEPGEKGETGATGITGKIGPAGEAGRRGDAGSPGQKGDKGDTGEPGTLGDKGDTGEPGTLGGKELDDILCKKGSRNCKELQDRGTILSGWYTIYPEGCNALTVLCDMETDGGGWIVFQRRWDGSVDFFRDWNAYKRGFGSQLTEFWLGNDNLHRLTATGTYELRIDLRDFENTHTFAKYSSFMIGGESEKYKLMLEAFTDGTAGDSLTFHKDQAFTTKDQDNDPNSGNCANIYNGAWWYNDCHYANLNGPYNLGAHTLYGNGVNWYTGKGHKYSYQRSEMKFRPV